MARILGIFLFLGVLTWDLVTDLQKWRGGVDINHTLEAFIRFGLLIPSLFFLSGFGIFFGPVKIGVPEKWFWKTVSALLLMAFTYWLLFDGLFSVFRGFNFWFNGSKDYNDGALDRLLMDLKDWQEACLKIGLVGFSLFGYIMVRNEKE